MKGSGSLTKLLRECPDIWFGSSKSANPQQNLLSTGYSPLDQRLNNSGWPQAGLIEVFASLLGIGEIKLFTPALKELINNPKVGITQINTIISKKKCARNLPKEKCFIFLVPF